METIYKLVAFPNWIQIKKEEKLEYRIKWREEYPFPSDIVRIKRLPFVRFRIVAECKIVRMLFLLGIENETYGRSSSRTLYLYICFIPKWNRNNVSLQNEQNQFCFYCGVQMKWIETRTDFEINSMLTHLDWCENRFRFGFICECVIRVFHDFRSGYSLNTMGIAFALCPVHI